MIGRFIQPHILGLMARLTDVINDSLATQPPAQEQRRCIRAMEEMIRVCKDYASIARPQVRSMFITVGPTLRDADFCMPPICSLEQWAAGSELLLLVSDAHSSRRGGRRSAA